MATIRQKQSTYAITISTFQQHRHFQRTAHAEPFIATLFRYRDAGKFQLHAFAVMPDHVHVLITPAIDQSTSRCIQLIKGGYSHAVRELTLHEVWHSGYHEHRIRDANDLRNQALYIANNPSQKDYLEYPHVHIGRASSPSRSTPTRYLIPIPRFPVVPVCRFPRPTPTLEARRSTIRRLRLTVQREFRLERGGS